MFRIVRQFIEYFDSRIRFKIILPFALLTIMVAAIGIYLTTRLVAGSLEERFARQLVESGQAAADGLTQREQLHLSALRAIAFTEGIDEAILAGDSNELEALLFPLIANYDIDRVDIVDARGRHLIEIHRPPGTGSVEDYIRASGIDLSEWAVWPGIQRVLSGVVDERGDKYAAMANLDGNYMFMTLGPVKQGDQVIGAVLVSSYVQDLLKALRQATFADVTLYDLEGRLITTTLYGRPEEMATLAIGPAEARAMLAVDGNSSLHQYVTLGGREYDLLVGIFQPRMEPLGFYSVALPTAPITAYQTTTRLQMAIIFAVTLLLVFGIGYVMASTITGRVRHLMENALAVASGDFTRRTQITSNDEIGSLARSLDDMTQSLDGYTRALKNKIEELMSLYESSTAVNVQSGLNLDHVLEAVTGSVRKVTKGIEQVIVYLTDDSGQVLVAQAATPVDPNGLTRLDYGETSPLRGLLITGAPQVVKLSQIEAYSLNGSPGNSPAELLIAPLATGQDVIGMLILLPEPGYSPVELLDDDDKFLLGTLANQAAIAIKNAQLFEATQQAYEELRQLDDLKTQFINIAAHELRTPLGAMMGYASFVEKRVPEKLHGAVRFLVASTLRMRTMVDAMLTIQRLDAGTAFLRRTPVDIREVFRKIIVDFQPMAELEGHTITADFPEELPMVEADAEKIGLVLSNLLSNAIKFTPDKGQIEVIVQDYLKGILVSVRDNGVGIPMEDQGRIFERFYQARADHIAGHGGMGLGLTIVKQLVELHDGQVWVDSTPGHGATFFFTVPYEIASGEEQADHIDAGKADIRLEEKETMLETV